MFVWMLYSAPCLVCRTLCIPLASCVSCLAFSSVCSHTLHRVCFVFVHCAFRNFAGCTSVWLSTWWHALQYYVFCAAQLCIDWKSYVIFCVRIWPYIVTCDWWATRSAGVIHRPDLVPPCFKVCSGLCNNGELKSLLLILSGLDFRLSQEESPSL